MEVGAAASPARVWLPFGPAPRPRAFRSGCGAVRPRCGLSPAAVRCCGPACGPARPPFGSPCPPPVGGVFGSITGRSARDLPEAWPSLSHCFGDGLRRMTQYIVPFVRFLMLFPQNIVEKWLFPQSHMGFFSEAFGSIKIELKKFVELF